MSVAGETLMLEFRPDRPAYDEQSPSTIWCDYPGGRRVASACSHRGLCGALTKAVLERYGVQLTPEGIRP